MAQDTTIQAPITMRDATGSDRWLRAALLGIVTLWGLNFVIIKVGLEQFDALVFCSLRQLLGVAVLVAILIVRRTRVRLTRRDAFFVLPLAAAGLTAGQITFHFGMASTTATNAAIIVATVPMTVALTNQVLRLEHLKPQNWAGVVLSLAGVGLIFGGEASLDVMSRHFKGNLWMLLSNVFWVTYIVMARPLMRRVPPLVLAALCMALGLPVMLLLAGPGMFTMQWSAVTFSGWAALLFAGVVAFGLGQVIWTRSIHFLGGTRTTVYGNVIPVVAVVAAAFFLDERMTAMQMIGGASVIVGVVLTQRGHEPTERQKEF